MAFFPAVSTALSLTATVYAEDESEPRETVRVGQFDCWVVDGDYYTEYDGEICEVINLGDMTAKRVDEVQLLSNATSSWEYDNVEIDISDGRKYQGLINIERYDDFTPHLYGNSK